MDRFPSLTSPRIAFGGGCHWCTEAVFQHLNGVTSVQQGWASSADDPARMSEAVVVHFEPERIPLEVLVAVHLHTHSCTSSHSMRGKYRSAIYGISDSQLYEARLAIAAQQADFAEPIITQVVRIGSFRQNVETYRQYYLKNPDKPFCQRYISPKLVEIQKRFGDYAVPAKASV